MEDPWRPDIPPEPQLPYRLWFDGVEHHATALGYVCITYALLEDTLNRLIELFLCCEPNTRRAIVDATGSSIRTRCQLVQKLAHIAQPPEPWLDRFDDELQRIQGELAPERNRLVHDLWLIGADIRQIDLRAPLNRPQAGQRKRVAPPAEPVRPLESVWDVVRRIQEVTGALVTLQFEYLAWHKKTHLP